MWRLAYALVLLGCDASGSYAEYCDIRCDCADCTDELREQCLAFGKSWEAHARELGCEEELSCFLGCINAHARCEGGRIDLGSGRDSCSDERAALPPACDPFVVQP